MMRYHRPKTLQEALAIRASDDVMPLAGGTDVYPAKVSRAGWGDMRHKDVLDLSLLSDLRGIREEDGGWRIGALATWSDIADARLPAACDGLRAAAREVGGVQIQNRGTIAGNICTASPAGDGAPSLLALDAQVEISSRSGARRVPLRDFITGYRKTTCGADELVTAILLPKRPEGARGAFLKLGARRYLVISIAMIGGVMATDGAGHITHARFGIGACSATPQRLDTLEADLIGTPLADAAQRLAPAHLAHLAPIDDVRASAAYRREAALQLTRDLLQTFAAQMSRRAA
jgi:xanthine dehydrogenase small subunit